MYLAVDIGGTKTLVAVFDKQGSIVWQQKFHTPKSYIQFTQQLKSLQADIQKYNVIACCCALPGRIDRKNGIGLFFGNLSWQNVPVKNDLESIFGDIPVLVENDAKLAGLSEAVLLLDRYKKALYLTFSTGIGAGVITNGKINQEFLNMEAGRMLFEHDGKIKKWEEIASAKALNQRFGQLASELKDPAAWREYSKGLALGIYELSATVSPDVIIIGGPVGAQIERFYGFLTEELSQEQDPMVNIPPIVKAKRPEEAVIYGCYELIKQSI